MVIASPTPTTTTSDATSTTAVPRVVGDPLPEWVVIGSGLALLVVILAAGLWIRGRMGPAERAGQA